MGLCKDLKTLTDKEFKEFLDSFDVVLSDCDGVLWKEVDVIKGSPETVAKIKQLGKKFFYITNNNCKTRAEIAAKCAAHSYAATEEEILCSSYLAASYLKQLNFRKKAYVVGSEGIGQELEAQGIKYVGIGPDVMEGDELDPLYKFERDPEIGAVIVGFDKDFSFPKLVKAGTYAHDRWVHFIATNPDVERPSPNDTRFPGAGCFIAAVEAIANRKALILGKPETFVSDVIKKKYGVNPSRTLMIGDNLKTDILLGQRCGFTTLLVMSGITTDNELAYLAENTKSAPVTPDFYADKLSDLLDRINKSAAPMTNGTK